MIARWRLLLANIQNLSEEQQDRLARAGWSGERIASDADLVEAYTAANITLKQKIHADRAASATAQTAETTLRKWYS